jgi:hypothetical protein
MARLFRAIHHLFLWVGRAFGALYSLASGQTTNHAPGGMLPALGTDLSCHPPHQWPDWDEETLASTLLALCQSEQEESLLMVDSAGAGGSDGGSPASREDPDEALRKELAAITRRLDALPFRKTNRRIYSLLNSPLGADLSPAVREHLVRRAMHNVVDAVNADPLVETLFLREHELEIILYKRSHADWYAVDGSVREAEG